MRATRTNQEGRLASLSPDNTPVVEGNEGIFLEHTEGDLAVLFKEPTQEEEPPLAFLEEDPSLELKKQSWSQDSNMGRPGRRCMDWGRRRWQWWRDGLTIGVFFSRLKKEIKEIFMKVQKRCLLTLAREIRCRKSAKKGEKESEQGEVD